RAVTVADHDMLPRPIHTHIVSIVSEIDPAACGVVRALKQSQRSVAAIGDIERVGARQVTNALGCLEPGKNLQDLGLINVDYGDRVVAELSYKQASPIDIGRHVIDTATNVTEGNFCFNTKNRVVRLC